MNKRHPYAAKQTTMSPDEVKAAVRASWSEKKFIKEVIALAEFHGWRVIHFDRGKASSGRWLTVMQGTRAKGFPDLLMLRGIRQVVAELKVGRNKASPEQLDWLCDFRLAAVPAYTWRPEHWTNIERILQ